MTQEERRIYLIKELQREMPQYDLLAVERFQDDTRHMSKKLGKGYSEAELRAVLAGEKEHIPTRPPPSRSQSRR